MEYLIKTSAVIFIFYSSYKLFLQRETFFQTNRWFLLVGILFAAFIPFIVIPIYIEHLPSNIENMASLNTNMQDTQMADEITFDVWQLIYYTYGIGVIFFLGKLGIELTSLKFLFNKCEYYRYESFTLVETNEDIPPFSFFNWIVYNPEKYSKEEFSHILNHEKAHAKELHSIDVILTHLACIMLWFNPFVWLYKKEIQQNLEFIADKKAQYFSECERSYQLILLKSSLPKHKFLMTNNFYNSQIKKRIIMLHKSKSNKLNAWKYGLILPVLALFLMSFNTEKIFVEIEDPSAEPISLIQPETPAQLNTFYENVKIDKNVEPPKSIKTSAITSSNSNSSISDSKSIAKVMPNQHKKDNSKLKGDISMTLITKNTTDYELNKIKEGLKKEGLTVKFKGIKRNSSSEITAIKIDVSSEKSKASYKVNSDDAIDSIKITFDEENNSISIGNTNAAQANTTYVYATKDINHKLHKSGSASNVYLFSEDKHEHDDEHEHDTKISVKNNIKTANVKRIKHAQNVEIISGDDGSVIDIIIDKDNNSEGKETIIVNGKKIKVIEGKVQSVWISDDDKEDDVIILKNVNDNIFISDNKGKDPLFIVDDIEITKEQLEDVKPDMIKSVTVLKDKSAIEKYGDKGKDGVVIIKIKNKN